MNKDNNSLRSSKRPPKTINVRYGWTDAQIKEQESVNAKSRQRREAEKLAVLTRRKTTTSVTKAMSTSPKKSDVVGGAAAPTGAANKTSNGSPVEKDPNATKKTGASEEFREVVFSSVSSETSEEDHNGQPNARNIAGKEFLKDKTHLKDLLKELENHFELGSAPEVINENVALIISNWTPIHARTITYIGLVTEAEANIIKSERVAFKNTFEEHRTAMKYSKAWAKRALVAPYEMNVPPPLNSDKDWRPKPMSQCNQVRARHNRCEISLKMYHFRRRNEATYRQPVQIC
jgi:hypothetical protein